MGRPHSRSSIPPGHLPRPNSPWAPGSLAGHRVLGIPIPRANSRCWNPPTPPGYYPSQANFSQGRDEELHPSTWVSATQPTIDYRTNMARAWVQGPQQRLGRPSLHLAHLVYAWNADRTSTVESGDTVDEQVNHPKNSAGSLVALVMAFSFGYAVLRYHIAGPVACTDFPFFIFKNPSRGFSFDFSQSMVAWMLFPLTTCCPKPRNAGLA